MSLPAKLARLNELRPLSPEAVRSLEAVWRSRMIYESNSIEGNSLTLRETELVLSRGITISEKSLKDHLEALNLAAAWDQLIELARPDSSLSETQLLDLHRLILTRIDDANAGRYRSGAVRIAGASHVPPNPLKVPDRMEALFAELPTIADPLERAARLHHGVAAIHPFTDGNGRTARLGMNFVLLAAGYPPLSISPTLRQDYYQALEAADKGHFSTWQQFLETQLETELDLWLEALEEGQAPSTFDSP